MPMKLNTWTRDGISNRVPAAVPKKARYREAIDAEFWAPPQLASAKPIHDAKIQQALFRYRKQKGPA